ncbi:MAG TPA: rhodanese-like domain-containing protein [Gemmatimonadaceae bacterium]
MTRRRLLPLLALLVQPALAQGGPGLLLTPTQLNAELRDPRLVLLYVGTREDYGAGHIAGARFIGMEDVAVDPRLGGLALELPDEGDLRQRLERFGISDDSRIVVVFGAGYVSPSTRIVWSLQTAGLGAQTRYLDGGMGAWKRAGLPLTTAEPAAATPGRLTRAADRSIVVDYRWVQAHANSPRVRLIDARSPVFFEGPGMERQGRRTEAGHIAGAKNLPFNSLNDDSLRFLPVEELRQRFAAAGVQPGDTVAAYCHVGQQATVVLFTARLLGHPIRLYDGSMNDWETRKLPLENATAPKPPERK